MSDNVNIDKDKMGRMITKIIGLEKQNARTQEFKQKQMIEQIQKIIEEEAKCL